jgi:outer membrane protein TolC
MKKQALLLSFILTSSFAIDISSIAANAIANNYDLKSIEKSIKIIDEDIKLATLWKNPTLTLGINDIHFDAPLTRDLEPMQGQFIGISQVVPMGEKLEIKEDIAKKDKKIMSLKLEEKKLKLKSKVYEVSFNILVLEKKFKLLNSYENNIKKIEKLSTALYKYGKATQNEILSSKIAFSNIQIQKQNLKNMIENYI